MLNLLKRRPIPNYPKTGKYIAAVQCSCGEITAQITETEPRPCVCGRTLGLEIEGDGEGQFHPWVEWVGPELDTTIEPEVVSWAYRADGE